MFTFKSICFFSFLNLLETFDTRSIDRQTIQADKLVPSPLYANFVHNVTFICTIVLSA